MDSGSKIISHSSIYLIGNILQRCVSFVMLPIYTRCLSPTDYGVIELLTLAVDFVGLVFGLRISPAIFRYYSQYEGRERNQVITSALYIVAGFSMIGVGLLVGLSNHIAMVVFKDPAQAGNLMLFALTLLGQSFVEIPMIGLKAAQKPVLFVSFSLCKVLIQLSLNIYFVVLLNMKVEGVIYSSLISTALMSIILCSYTFYTRGMILSYHKAGELITFSIPLVLTDMLSFYLTFGDRYFLRLYSGLAEVGIYSLAYKFGFLLSFLVISPFGSIWDSEKYVIAKTKDYQTKFQEVFVLYGLALTSMGILISVYIKDLIAIMAAPEFFTAYRVVPIVLAAYVVNAWAGFTNLGIYLSNKTVEIFYGTILAVAVVSAGYLLLIPRFGGMGAAVATLLAFAARTIWVYFRSKRLFNMGLKWRNIVYLSGLWLAVIILLQFSPEKTLFSIFYSSVVILLIVAVLVLLPIIPGNIKVKIWRSVSGKLFGPRMKNVRQSGN